MKTENDPTGGTGHAEKAGAIPAWWLEVPDAEKAVIRDVLTAIRGLKGSRSPQVGQAARKWERSIACFIKFRLMGGASRTGNRAKGRMGSNGFQRDAETDPRDAGATASPTSSRSPRGASPARDSMGIGS